jgi:hypothetical protein
VSVGMEGNRGSISGGCFMSRKLYAMGAYPSEDAREKVLASGYGDHVR